MKYEDVWITYKNIIWRGCVVIKVYGAASSFATYSHCAFYFPVPPTPTLPPTSPLPNSHKAVFPGAKLFWTRISRICTIFGTLMFRNWTKTNEWKTKTGINPLHLMQTALTSLWCCAGWKFPSKLRIFSLPHHPPVGLHPSQGDKQTFPGRNRILSVNSSSAKPQRLSRGKAE